MRSDHMPRREERFARMIQTANQDIYHAKRDANDLTLTFGNKTKAPTRGFRFVGQAAFRAHGLPQI